jgi:hypothetical protein
MRLVLACLLLTASLSAQTFGSLTGDVVAGAAITVRNTAANGVRNATTNEDGVYSIPALVSGLYEVKAEKPGFKSASRANVELQVQQAARVDFNLEIG